MANKLIEDTKVQIEMLLSGKYTFSPFDTAEILQKLVDALQKCEQTHVSGSLPPVEQDLLDEAVGDVMTICRLNKPKVARKLISDQFYVAAKIDLFGGNDH